MSTPESSIPVGFCRCGCGQKTNPAKQGDTKRGYAAGEPQRFAPGHNGNRRPLRDRWEEKVERLPSGCWKWTGAIKKDGYGYISRGTRPNRMATAHHVSYELHVGPVDPGMDVDHLCRNRWCVNPAHLEAVTHRENCLRGVAPNMIAWRTGVCHRGHALTDDNVIINTRKSGTIKRRCRTCARMARETRGGE